LEKLETATHVDQSFNLLRQIIVDNTKVVLPERAELRNSIGSGDGSNGCHTRWMFDIRWKVLKKSILMKTVKNSVQLYGKFQELR
jgi:hypothetical protein